MAYESEGSLKLYLRDIAKTPLLTVEEENTLAEKIKNGDEKAREQMIKANLRLVIKIARDYENYGVPVLDLISEGNIGLMKAVEKFDPSKGAKLSTYAAWWIKQSIKRALANQSRTIRLPVHMVDKIARLRRIEAQQTGESGRETTNEDIEDATGISENKIRILRNASQQPTSLDAPISAGEATTYGEMIADEYAVDPFDMLSDKNIHAELSGLLDILDTREKEIITRRFRLNGDEEIQTLEEVGAEFGVTRERIRQLQNIALGKMRKALGKKEKQPFQVSQPKEDATACVANIIEILSVQPTYGEARIIVHNADISYEKREKGLRNLVLEKDESWYSLSVRAIRELRRIQGNSDRKKVTYADIETFLRATVFARKK